MRIGRMFQRDAQTFLVHLFGKGLDGERYVVERYRSLSNGEIEPVQPGQSQAKGRRRQRRTIVGVGTVKKMRPERDEIIVCTALNLKGSGVQYWGSAAVGFLAVRNAR